MSKFFKALEQAERDRALNQQSAPTAAAPVPRVPAAPLPEPPAAEPGRRLTMPSPASAPASPPKESAPGLTAVSVPPGIDPHLVSLLEPGALEAEPYRALRHLVEQRRQLTGLSVLVVASPGTGDGKTTTAINLAGALAQDPKARVLLIEADLRSPALAARLGLHGAGSRGLVEAILDPRVALDAVVEPCPPFNLDIIPAGHRRGVPYELLASPRFTELIEAARARYDYVLIDAPPLVPFPDGRVFASSVDGYLLVVSASHTPRKLVADALSLLDPAKLIGLVFNGEERSTGRDYYPERRPATPTSGGNGDSGRGWLAAVLPQRRRRRRAARAGRGPWS